MTTLTPARFELSPRLFAKTVMGSPLNALLLYWVALAATGRLLPSSRDLALLLAGYLTLSVLFAYNNYRGRVGDALSSKASKRPLAGHAERHPSVEVAIVAEAVLGILLAWACGAWEAALCNAAAICWYLAVFQNRLARRPTAWLKPLSGTVSLMLVLWGFSRALGADGIRSALITAVLSCWRLAFELVADVMDLDADLRRGEQTPATRYGPAVSLRVAAVVGVGAFLATAVIDVMAFQAAPLILGYALLGAFLTGGAAMATRKWAPERAWPVMRQAANLLLTLGLAALLAAGGAPWSSVGWVAFMLLFGDRQQLIQCWKLLRA